MTETSPYTYKIVKLVNGEDIICTIANEDNNVEDRYHRVLYPLKMQIVPKMVDGGIAESLNLSPAISSPSASRVKSQISTFFSILIFLYNFDFLLYILSKSLKLFIIL